MDQHLHSRGLRYDIEDSELQPVEAPIDAGNPQAPLPARVLQQQIGDLGEGDDAGVGGRQLEAEPGSLP